MQLTKQPVPISITPDEEKIVGLIADCAKQSGKETYLVGGYIRDKILNRESKDIDVMVVGSGIEMAKAIAEALEPKPPLAVYENFGTALLKYVDFNIEFVGARRESYR